MRDDEPTPPTGTRTGTQHPAPPRLASLVAAHHHLLLLSDEVDPDEVDALVTSLVVGAAWRTPPAGGVPGVIDLLAGDDAATIPHRTRATLTGPWAIDAIRDTLSLPTWASTAFVLDVEPERSGPAPVLPGGYGPLLDSFGDHHPIGVERQALDVLLAIARRLAGAVRTTGGALVEPDPASAVDLAVHAPHWLDPDALALVLRTALPGLDVLPGAEVVASHGHTLEGYGALWHREQLGDDHVLVEVEAAEVLVPAVRHEPWVSDGVISYHLRWVPDDGGRTPATRAGRRRREHARRAIEEAALALHEAVGGRVVDEDTFLLTPEQLATDAD